MGFHVTNMQLNTLISDMADELPDLMLHETFPVEDVLFGYGLYPVWND